MDRLSVQLSPACFIKTHTDVLATMLVYVNSVSCSQVKEITP